MSGVDPDFYRRVMGRFATGVTIVTTRTGDIEHAMTANAVVSLSLDPVLLGVSIEVDARFHDAVLEAGVWGISILPSSATGTAQWLATRGRPLHNQLARIPHVSGLTGVALLSGALAHVECETTDTLRTGDHTLLVGHVVSVATGDDQSAALVYYRGQFGALQ
ncbi:flavin reductase (DIM6/NTAB) family NADH-FMN oxidoreductase RutF [Branchiibius hedensis]|uniref:NADH-FMN oxidoreductase RutF, flavin reductase (DIM6/NTAB) family n=1 Tax=Branchiibius hedensis TaxID=672460 RepID=A0A2Y8ZS19_9MICO|nr:flavin reductase family protein [Branchiibius hedensis]PWJ24292.1 flavin reductase (DIM6/NTAB) family NADH-FMN oxidoreductase RutF [Branchiibius hedensis]SSA33109.1 NADH-FMN oxidoreductase RutF, flavin reductase (DIM6/NTAB) family [Branchiibius hedensis]